MKLRISFARCLEESETMNLKTEKFSDWETMILKKPQITENTKNCTCQIKKLGWESQYSWGLVLLPRFFICISIVLSSLYSQFSHMFILFSSFEFSQFLNFMEFQVLYRYLQEEGLLLDSMISRSFFCYGPCKFVRNTMLQSRFTN